MAGIIQAPLPIAANTGVIPNLKTMATTDNLATITTAAYLNANNLNGYPVSPNDIINVLYSYDLTTNSGTYGLFEVSISNGIITLIEYQPASGVNATLPTTLGHIATYSNTVGDITEDPATAFTNGNLQLGESGTIGSLFLFPAAAANGFLLLTAQGNPGDYSMAITNAVIGQDVTIAIPDPGNANAEFIINRSALGLQTISSGSLQISNGNLIAGDNGFSAGYIESTAPTLGALKVAAINNTGNFTTTISNKAMGQASVISIPDPLAATAVFTLAAGALSDKNLLRISGTTGLMEDAGAALVSGTTADIGGGGAGPISVLVANLVVGSPITATIASSTNVVAVAKCIATATGFDITFTGDPGAACVVNYVATTAAIA